MMENEPEKTMKHDMQTVVIVDLRDSGFPKIRGPFSRCLNEKNYGVSGSILGSPR